MSRPRLPRVSEKVVQSHIVQALRTVGATVYVLGTVHAGEPGRMTTRQTPGLPDLLVHLPASPMPARPPRLAYHTQPHQLWIEVKAQGGRLSSAQASFRDFCDLADLPHLVGGLDVVLAYLQAKGYVREYPGQYRKAGAA